MAVRITALRRAALIEAAELGVSFMERELAGIQEGIADARDRGVRYRDLTIARARRADLELSIGAARRGIEYLRQGL